MSMYAGAMVQGTQMVSGAMFGVKSSAEIQAYNNAYSQAVQRYNAREALHDAELNIAAIEQDKVTSNTNIQIQQSQAEAQAKVNAAVAGVTGQSVDDSIYNTKANAAFARRAVEDKSTQALQSESASVFTNASDARAVQDTEYSFGGELMQEFANFEYSDIKLTEAFWSK